MGNGTWVMDMGNGDMKGMGLFLFLFLRLLLVHNLGKWIGFFWDLGLEGNGWRGVKEEKRVDRKKGGG